MRCDAMRSHTRSLSLTLAALSRSQGTNTKDEQQGQQRQRKTTRRDRSDIAVSGPTQPLAPSLLPTLEAYGRNLYGTDEAIQRAGPALGHLLPARSVTDFVTLGLGIVAGLLLGELSLRLGPLNLTLGTGGGALVAGLVLGWLHMHRPQYGAIPADTAQFMKDFGLATFIAAVGLSVGPDAFALLREYGVVLPVLAILVSALPALISLYIGHYLLRIEAPILLGAIAGQHCSTPSISALVSLAGNSTPVIGYTVTYAISNVLLPLMGPVVVGMVGMLR